MEAAIIVVLVVVFAILVVMMIIALGSRRKDSKTISFESKTTDEPKQLTQQEKSGNYQAQGGFNFAPAKKEEAVLPGQELKTSATAAIPTAAQSASQPTAHTDAPSASAVSEKPHEDPEPVAEAAVAEPGALTVEAEAKPEDPAVVTKKPEKETETEDEPVAVVTETAADSEPETKPEPEEPEVEEPETKPEEPEGEKPDAKSEAAENEEQPEAEPVDDEPVENQSAVAEPEADDAAGVNAETVEDRSAKKPVETDEVQPAKKPAAEDEPEKEEVKEEVAKAPQPAEQPEPSKPGRQKRNKPQKRQKQRGKKQQSRAAAQEKLEEAVAADEASEKPQKSDSNATKDHKEEPAPAPQNAQSDRDEQAKDVADTELEGSFEKLDEFHELVEELPDSEEIPVVEQAEPEDVDKQDALEAAAAASAVAEAADKARAETPAPTEESKPADVEPKPQDTIEPAVGRIGKLRGRLSKSQNVFGRSVLGMLSAGDLDDDAWEDIETQLIQADLGVKITTNVVDELREMIAERGVSSEDEARAMLRECLIAACKPELDRSIKAMPYNGKPAVVLVVGVNGTGKTTTTGKLARVLVSMGHKVLLGAADTFRAAAADQLEAWGRRVGATTVRGAEAADPASVAFDAVSKGVETHADVVLIDTAGRLHNSTNLMDQLRKVKRVVEKKAVVDEVLLVLDATTGQNGLVQAKTFGDVVNITGVVLTKLDGTAKGGIVFQVQEDLGVPVKLVGLGEGADDLAPFEVEGFVDALLG